MVISTELFFPLKERSIDIAAYEHAIAFDTTKNLPMQNFIVRVAVFNLNEKYHNMKKMVKEGNELTRRQRDSAT